MIIKSLKIKNFRNYELLSIELSKDINIFYGDNAQGKTNILEALFVCGTTKSHRGSKDRDMIRFEQEESHIEMIVEKEKIVDQIDMHLKKNAPKGVAVNRVPIKRASQLFGIVKFVFFSPEDLNIIKNGPSERRRFIDIELSQLDKIYLNDLSKYNQALNQRNRLLKELYYSKTNWETLDIWDEQLTKYGTNIVKRRNKFISEVNEIIYNIHYKLTGEKEKIKVTYEPDAGESTKQFLEKLKKNREKDLKYKSTTVGPHRDDICFEVDGLDIRKYGSQGQQRTAALSLKMSEIELVKKTIYDTPVLLLDDVLSELDKNRQNYLLDSIHDIQTLITCTGMDEFVGDRFHMNKVFHVQSGTVVSEN